MSISPIRYNIPVHPEPSIFETTVVEVDGKVITHVDIEEILAQPKWTAAALRAKVEAQMRKTHRYKPLPGAGGGKVLVPKQARKPKP